MSTFVNCKCEKCGEFVMEVTQHPVPMCCGSPMTYERKGEATFKDYLAHKERGLG